MGRRLAGDGVRSVTDRSLQKKHRRQAASHSPWSQQDSGITLSTGVGMIGLLEITLIVPHAPRGNAAQDAPRPLLNVAQMRGQAPALPTSCARLTESAICAICDAERHGRHAHAERWARSVSGRSTSRRRYWRTCNATCAKLLRVRHPRFTSLQHVRFSLADNRIRPAPGRRADRDRP